VLQKKLSLSRLQDFQIILGGAANPDHILKSLKAIGGNISSSRSFSFFIWSLKKET